MLSSGLYFKVEPLRDAMKHRIQEIKDTTSLALEKATCEVLLHHCLNVDDIPGQRYHQVRQPTQRSEADEIYDDFILHFMIEMLRITDDLCQKFREHGLDPLFKKVKLLCKDHEIEVPSLSPPYQAGRDRFCINRDNLTIEHQCRFDKFIFGIDSLLTEMNYCFNDDIVELVALSFALDPRNNYKAFWEEDIYKLMNDFYPDDFMVQEKLHMKIQLEQFQLDAHQSTEL
ncbi:hypothetical protein J1N35_043747 [Gossypium stocksii]|uniref:Uncharacterized protein n=1 Tax=Gossypium stocksii TaxID=47602 RepID=A0A9D3U7X1_9ROSI|nr:hypothetical protein J1N35_043747 [Gossypium stocksii]